MGTKMITNRFIFHPEFRQKITGKSQETPEFRKTSVMVSRSEIILALFCVARTVTSTDGLRCGVLSCAVLSCPVDNFYRVFRLSSGVCSSKNVCKLIFYWEAIFHSKYPLLGGW